MDGNSLTRRQFVTIGLTAAGALAIGFAPPDLARAAMVAAAPWGRDDHDPRELNPWIVIEPDDTTIIRYAKSEMGQGSMTALAMIVAEELQCDWSKVKVEYASANRNFRENTVYKSMSTGGSTAVRLSREFLQQAGASARARLIAAAAARWKVAPVECMAANSMVLHKASGRRLGYGALLAAAAQIALDAEPPIKTPEQYTLLGKPMPRLDTPLKIDGRAKFGIDTRVDGMVYAAIAACPVPGGRLISVDDAPLRGRRGIERVVKLDDAVVVVADRFWRAKEAVAALQPQWDFGAGAGTDSVAFQRAYRAALDGPAANARNDGDVAAALASAARTLEAVYEVPYLSHAAMEPLNCTAYVQPDRVDVWVGTQVADLALKMAAAAADVTPEQVYLHNCFVGGGFGRRLMPDEVVQAVRIAKEIGKPVKLVWTREEDIRHDRYRPQAAIRFKAGLAADGTLVALDIRTAVGSLARSLGRDKVESGVEPSAVEGLATAPYKVDNFHVDCVLKNTHVPVMPWRSVGSTQNAFAIESFMDELAHGTRQDPYKFRRNLLAHRADFITVLDTLVQKGEWGKTMPQGKAQGIAIHECFGTIVGELAEVAVSPKGEVKVERVVVVTDSGHVVNPRTVENQMEGAVIYGLSATLYGAITIKDGRPEQGNFDTYQVVRMAEAPRIETHLALSGGKKWGGIGEPGTPPISAAVCNAIFAVTGQRIRSLPIKSNDLSGHV